MNERKKSLEIMKRLTSRKGELKDVFHQHGKGKNPPKRGSIAYNFFLGRMERKIRAREPIEFIIGFAGHKNLKACEYPTPDMSEFMSLKLLTEMAKSVKNIYDKGVVIHIITFDARSIFANNALKENTEKYFLGLKKMIEKNEEFSKCFRVHKLSNIWNKDFCQLLDKTVAEIKTDIKSDPDFPHLASRARKNSLKILSDDEVEQAVARFKASFIAEREFRLWDKIFPGVILLSYRVNPWYGTPYLLPWTTHKGEVTQPWHGWWNKHTGEVMSPYRQELARWMFRWN